MQEVFGPLNLELNFTMKTNQEQINSCLAQLFDVCLYWW